VTFGVRDQLDCDFVSARIPGERSCGQLGQLFVVALRQTRPDFSDVLLDDVEIVQQPVAGRADIESALSPAIEFVIDAIEYLFGILETKKQRT
jgi:hypothetical protein